MVSQLLGETSSLESHVTNASNSVLSAVHYNEDPAKAAYSYVFKFLADQIRRAEEVQDGSPL